jgi:glycosyltransferase involved in cell wall biosynthesis
MRIFLASATEHLTDHLPLSEGLIALNIMEGLTARGHEVVACADRVSLRTPARSTVVELGKTGRFESLTPFTRPRAIDRVLAAHGPGTFDVIHWLFPQDPDEIRLPRSPGARTVIGPLMGRWPAGPPRRRRAGDYVRAALGPALRRRHDHVMCSADVLLAAHPEVISALPAELQAKAVLLGFGIDETRFAPTPLPERPTFLFVGRLIEEKGVRTLLAAFAAVSRELVEARLMIVGDGPLMPWVRDFCGNGGLADRVEIVGVVPYDEIPEILSRCSVLCLPSVGEPYGMAVVEAMSAARAVIAVDRAGPAHLLRRDDGGRRVPPHDVDALAAAMMELAADPERLGEMGQANRRHVLAELTCTHMVDQVESVYEGGLPSDGAG